MKSLNKENYDETLFLKKVTDQRNILKINNIPQRSIQNPKDDYNTIKKHPFNNSYIFVYSTMWSREPEENNTVCINRSRTFFNVLFAV